MYVYLTISGFVEPYKFPPILPQYFIGSRKHMSSVLEQVSEPCTVVCISKLPALSHVPWPVCAEDGHWLASGATPRTYSWAMNSGPSAWINQLRSGRKRGRWTEDLELELPRGKSWTTNNSSNFFCTLLKTLNLTLNFLPCVKMRTSNSNCRETTTELRTTDKVTGKVIRIRHCWKLSATSCQSVASF